jgi:hypothetical protein
MKNPSSFEFVQLRCAVASGSVDIPQAVADALGNPIDFPSIDLALVPGDCVAIAVHESLPHPEPIVKAIVEWLLSKHPASDLSIRVVLAPGNESLTQELDDWLATRWPVSDLAGDLSVDQATDQATAKSITESTPSNSLQRVLCHDPDDQQNLEYIFATEQSEAIYLNRELVEADFVIPIYRWLEPKDPRGHDPYVVLPAFGDRATQARYAKSWLEQHEPARGTHKKASESGWLAGIQYAIGAVANQEGLIAMLVGGAPETVDKVCSQGVHAAPNPTETPSQEGFELVVVELVDPLRVPSWNQVASAAWSAQRWLSPAGRIVVVATSLAEVTPGIGALASDDPDEELQQTLLTSSLQDAYAAAILRDIQSRRSVYVQSQVDPELLESLGFASIRDPSELERLMQKSKRVGVMEY